MRVSVITVVRNARDRIGSTLASVTGQTWTDREVIVVDGLSTDGTLDIVKSFGSRVDRLIVGKDTGIYDAMNKGIRAATGEWLIFMNAGDEFHDTRVLERIAPLLADPRPLLCGRYEKVWNGIPVLFEPTPLRPGLMPASHQATLVRADAARQHEFNPSLRVSGDYDQVCRISDNQSENIQFTDIIIARVEGEGFSSVHARASYREYRDIIVRHGGLARGWAWYLRTLLWTTLTGAAKRLLPHSVIGRVRQFRSGPR